MIISRKINRFLLKPLFVLVLRSIAPLSPRIKVKVEIFKEQSAATEVDNIIELIIMHQAENSGRLNYQKENRRKLTLGETGAYRLYTLGAHSPTPCCRL